MPIIAISENITIFLKLPYTLGPILFNAEKTSSLELFWAWST